MLFCGILRVIDSENRTCMSSTKANKKDDVGSRESSVIAVEARMKGKSREWRGATYEGVLDLIAAEQKRREPL
ncbi:hypothetical protein ACFX2A_023229 [Malus domestica]